MFGNSFSSLNVLTKDELRCIEITDEMTPSIKKVIRRNISFRIFVSIFFLLFTYIIVESFVNSHEQYVGKVMYTGPRPIDNVIHVVSLIISLSILIWNSFGIFSLRLNNIKYADYYRFYRRGNVKLNNRGKVNSSILSLTSVHAIDNKRMKRLKRAYSVGGIGSYLCHGGEYLFISSNGKSFYLVPFIKRPGITEEEVIEEIYEEVYEDEVSEREIIKSDDSLSPSMREWFKEDDISDLDDKRYSTNSVMLNEDDEFMFDKFKKKCYLEAKSGSIFALIVFLMFSFIIGFLAMLSGHDSTSIAILVFCFLFIGFICSAFVYNGFKECRSLKNYFSDVVDLECCSVVDHKVSLGYDHVKLTFNLKRENGLIEYRVTPKLINVRHKVEEGDTLFLIKVKDVYYCYPSMDTYKKMKK